MIHHAIHLLHETDKQQHILVSCIIMMACLVFMTFIPSFIVTFAIGIAKEIWDKIYGTGFCWYDMLGNMVGIVVAIALYPIIN